MCGRGELGVEMIPSRAKSVYAVVRSKRRKGTDVSIAQRFAQVFGGIYLLVGIAGFIPPLLMGRAEAAGTLTGSFMGLLFGLFAVSWLHSLAHAVIGIAGLAVYRSPTGARTYALALGIVYALIFVLGLITGNTTFGGLLPLNLWDNILHIGTSLLAFGAFFASGATSATSPRT
jgi:hypothetical protein